MTKTDRLRAVRQLALRGGDFGLAAECEAALERAGADWRDDPHAMPVLEAVVPPKPRRSKVKPDGLG